MSTEGGSNGSQNGTGTIQEKFRKYIQQIQSFRGTIRQKAELNSGSSVLSLQQTEGRASQITQGIEGFQDMCLIMREGSDVCKEIASIISERSILELNYSKGLQKLSVKLSKACTGVEASTTCQSWDGLAQTMISESEAHRKTGEYLMNEIYRPLKNLYENHAKVRKPIELAVEKATKHLARRKMKAHKYKTKFFTNTSDIEKLHEQIMERRANRKTPDKELQRMELKFNSLKENLRTCGKKYYNSCIAVELARQEWQHTNNLSISQLRQLEEERLKDLTKYLKLYKAAIQDFPDVINSVCNQLDEAAVSIDYEQDLRQILKIQTNGLAVTEQTLFECYAEDMTKRMDQERRHQLLALYMYYMNMEIQAQLKISEELKCKLEEFSNAEFYTDSDILMSTSVKHKQVCAMLNFLDASHYKLAKALHQIKPNAEVTHYQHSDRMEITKDKSGLPVTILSIPSSQVTDRQNMARVQHRATIYFSEDDAANMPEYEVLGADPDFSDSDDEYQGAAGGNTPEQVYQQPYEDIETCNTVVCKCRVLYDFTATQESEIHLKEGENVNVYEKSGGWWRGELNGAIGMFPSNYVEEL